MSGRCADSYQNSCKPRAPAPFRPPRIPSRPPAVAATDRGRRAAERAQASGGAKRVAMWLGGSAPGERLAGKRGTVFQNPRCSLKTYVPLRHTCLLEAYSGRSSLGPEDCPVRMRPRLTGAGAGSSAVSIQCQPLLLNSAIMLLAIRSVSRSATWPDAVISKYCLDLWSRSSALSEIRERTCPFTSKRTRAE